MMIQMDWLNNYRASETTSKLLDEIRMLADQPARFMEVCGGHTMAIQKFGIPSLLPPTVQLISGPGCPVCVSSRKFIDHAIALSKRPDIILTTFGDLIRVPGSTTSLEKQKALGHDIRIVYSSLQSINIALQNPDKKIVFLGIGFETTAPTTAATILTAYHDNIKNFYVLSTHKIMPPVMEALVEEGVSLDGFIGPGHVSTITGMHIFKFLAQQHGLGVVISGFEPVDILYSIYKLLKQKRDGTPKVEIQYSRAVRPEGNPKAVAIMNNVFETRADWWRGLGIIEQSGLKIRENFAQFDAEKQIEVEIEETREDKGCICGAILKGVKSPTDCSLFARKCTPQNPVGACMVSNEGACHANFRYNGHNPSAQQATLLN